jgi:hypothetical protein
VVHIDDQGLKLDKGTVDLLLRLVLILRFLIESFGRVKVRVEGLGEKLT